MKSFTESVDEFKNANSWLSASDQPALVALQAMAERLDGDDFSPALVAQFGLVYRSLLKRQPAAVPEEDPLDALLDDVREE